MRISHINLENWKNFRKVDVDLSARVFLAGPNASGKSNFLDAFRFLRDLAIDGLQKAVVDNRGGVSKLRCLSARRYTEITLEVTLMESSESSENWKYLISFNQDKLRRPYVVKEKVWYGEKQFLDRPTPHDREDKELLSQTALEQISLNREFRVIAEFFKTVYYQHLVPQIIRNPQDYQMTKVERDPFGRDFLEQLASTVEKTRNSRLNKIVNALQVAVPQLSSLELHKDHKGVPHLEGRYDHWRAEGAKQSEEQFSDGTLRLIGLLWSLFEGDGPLLLEEPELSLHPGVVKKLAPMIHRLQKKKTGIRQVIVSTHSHELLSDSGIGGEEALLLLPSKEGTEIKVASSIEEVKALLEAGMSIAEAALPRTEPKNLTQLDMFK